jgi:hypothetical protein
VRIATNEGHVQRLLKEGRGASDTQIVTHKADIQQCQDKIQQLRTKPKLQAVKPREPDTHEEWLAGGRCDESVKVRLAGGAAKVRRDRNERAKNGYVHLLCRHHNVRLAAVSTYAPPGV